MRSRYLTSAIVAAMLGAGMAPVVVMRRDPEPEPEPKRTVAMEPVPPTSHKPHQGKREAARRLRQMARARGEQP